MGTGKEPDYNKKEAMAGILISSAHLPSVRCFFFRTPSLYYTECKNSCHNNYFSPVKTHLLRVLASTLQILE